MDVCRCKSSEYLTERCKCDAGNCWCGLRDAVRVRDVRAGTRVEEVEIENGRFGLNGVQCSVEVDIDYRRGCFGDLDIC